MNEVKGMYATFEDYKAIFLLGRNALIPESEFAFWSTQASGYIDNATFNRLGNEEILLEHKERVVKAACGVAELLYKNNLSPKIKSQSIGSFSQTFIDEKTMQDDIQAVLSRELGLTGLLYRGA